jgi:prophage maintenance system killer protein
MERLVQLHQEHVSAGVPVEVEAAWLHHRFVQIHPYQDGNGRVARALASLVFLRAGWFPVVVTRDDKVRYIDSLEEADDGELRSLIALFVDIQKRALFQATKVAADVQPPAETVEAAIAVARRVLTGPGRNLEPSVWLKAKESSDRLELFRHFCNPRHRVAASATSTEPRTTESGRPFLRAGPYSHALCIRGYG